MERHWKSLPSVIPALRNLRLVSNKMMSAQMLEKVVWTSTSVWPRPSGVSVMRYTKLSITLIDFVINDEELESPPLVGRKQKLCRGG